MFPNYFIWAVLLHSCLLACDHIFGPIPWGHSGPLCHALSLSSLALRTSMRRRRATVQWRHLVNWREAARCGEWAQQFSNASCIVMRLRLCRVILHLVLKCKMQIKLLTYNMFLCTFFVFLSKYRYKTYYCRRHWSLTAGLYPYLPTYTLPVSSYRQQPMHITYTS